MPDGSRAKCLSGQCVKAMPTLAAWFVKSALIYLVASLVVAVTLAMLGPLNLPSVIGSLMPVYFHALINN